MNFFYDPNYVSSHYDEVGEKEWHRFENSIKSEVNLFIHNYYLKKYIQPNSKVLEIGAGPGRFTIELAKLGCSIAVVDISQKQLDLNKEKVTDAGFEQNVLWRKKLDIIDLHSIQETFDAVIIYGGPLSYVFDKITIALEQIFKLLKKEGKLLFSVMSLHGTVHYFIKELYFDEIVNFGLDETDRVNKTGNLNGPIADKHICKLYSWGMLEPILSQFPCNILAVSASNYLANNSDDKLLELRKNEEVWKKFLEWEVQYTSDMGSVNNGSNIIVVLEKK